MEFLKGKWKYFLFIAAAAVVFFLLPKNFSDFLFNRGSNLIVQHTIIDTSEIINSYKLNLKQKLQKQLLDSLQNVIKPELITVYKFADKDSIYREAKKYYNNTKKDTSENPWYYVSAVDTLINIKDSTGRITDVIDITSKFISPYALSPYSLHRLALRHKRINYKERKVGGGLLGNFTISGQVGAGYGVIHKQFDIYTGIGISYKIN